ncbi:MAG: hypothetical protein QNI99_20340 [Woeseiaceae bacterium]|nr:hypothetical protein [Woeseiaceae bacterium]
MIRFFIVGVVLGITGVIAGLYLLPAVDQARESSIITVAPNGGNFEAFHVNIPMDRIMVGAPGQDETVPPELEWPEDPMFDEARAELFKLRNTRDAVVGVASRIAARDESGDVVEWVLHLPARGSVFVTMDPTPVNGRRAGSMRAGTREFSDLVGRVSESWVADASDGVNAGRIELQATFVSTIMDDDDDLVDAAAEEEAE